MNPLLTHAEHRCRACAWPNARVESTHVVINFNDANAVYMYFKYADPAYTSNLVQSMQYFITKCYHSESYLVE